MLSRLVTAGQIQVMRSNTSFGRCLTPISSSRGLVGRLIGESMGEGCLCQTSKEAYQGAKRQCDNGIVGELIRELGFYLSDAIRLK